MYRKENLHARCEQSSIWHAYEIFVLFYEENSNTNVGKNKVMCMCVLFFRSTLLAVWMGFIYAEISFYSG